MFINFTKYFFNFFTFTNFKNLVQNLQYFLKFFLNLFYNYIKKKKNFNLLTGFIPIFSYSKPNSKNKTITNIILIYGNTFSTYNKTQNHFDLIKPLASSALDTIIKDSEAFKNINDIKNAYNTLYFEFYQGLIEAPNKTGYVNLNNSRETVLYKFKEKMRNSIGIFPNIGMFFEEHNGAPASESLITLNSKYHLMQLNKGATYIKMNSNYISKNNTNNSADPVDVAIYSFFPNKRGVFKTYQIKTYLAFVSKDELIKWIDRAVSDEKYFFTNLLLDISLLNEKQQQIALNYIENLSTKDKKRIEFVLKNYFLNNKNLLLKFLSNLDTNNEFIRYRYNHNKILQNQAEKTITNSNSCNNNNNKYLSKGTIIKPKLLIGQNNHNKYLSKGTIIKKR